MAIAGLSVVLKSLGSYAVCLSSSRQYKVHLYYTDHALQEPLHFPLCNTGSLVLGFEYLVSHE